VNDLLDIYPGELIAEIRDLFATGFVFEGEVSLKDVEEVMDAGFDATIAELGETDKGRLPEDVHDYISLFACFRKNDVCGANRQISPVKVPTANKEKARTKLKKAKISKRKNRQ
jgi:hypothetical protein